MSEEIRQEACAIHFLDNDIVHVHFLDGRLVTPEDVQTMFDAVEERRRGRKALLMVSVGDKTTMTNEARAYASAPESSRYIAADAIILRDFSHQLAANVFVRYHKPGRPIQMFPDKESAMSWLAEQHHLIGP
ncbi:MAG: hypothetical protein H6595_07485 [Flavobacteriales bacterium]|nr:hypothetical protein [Flavobacteriales bacterium]MCB9167308.1 hypothetical protein [Flavobacteriales bacterium]